MTKPRVLYVVKGYPQISQTYVKHELEAVWDEYDVRIVCRKEPNVAYANHYPYELVTETPRIREIVEEYRPTVLHTHYLNQLEVVGQLAEQTGVPFTVRAHSFDALALRRRGLKSLVGHAVSGAGRNQLRKDAALQKVVRQINDDLCLGALIFPFTRRLFEDLGIDSDKLVDCWPVIHYERFHDRSPNGHDVMNTGAAIPKKNMSDFIRLASAAPGPTYRLYALGYEVDDLRRENERAGGPVDIVNPVEPEQMPAEYKRHRWLVYTGSFKVATVGWPMAVAEAQAAGVGVCMPNIRPDVKTYVGDAGIVYDSIDDLRDVVRAPVPEEMREAGFEQAKKSDVFRHKRLLTELWDKASVRVPAGQPH